MPDEREIRIHLVSGAPRAWLCLQGTILSYRERFWSRETTVDIPVELVTFSEQKRFKGSRLITALLSLLFLPVFGVAITRLWHLIAGAHSDRAWSIFMGTFALATGLTFLFLCVRSFVRQKTMTIRVAPASAAISFWIERKQESRLQDMVLGVERAKTVVTETIAYPMRLALGITIQQPWKRTVLLVTLAAIPALLTEIPWLFAVCLVPLGLHIHASLREARQPREFRQAIRCFFKREWNQARDLVRQLIRATPGYQPAKILLIELLMRVEDFDGAETALAEIHGELDPETIQAIQQDIIGRRRVAHRKSENRDL